LLTALQQANPAPASDRDTWVYLGEYDEQKHKFRNPPTFSATSPPSAGSTIVSTQDVYKRSVKPYKDDKGNWQLGAIKGVLPKGTSVTVLEAARIEGENQYDYNSWLKVQPEQ